MWMIAFKANLSSLRQQWLRGLIVLCIGAGMGAPGAAFGSSCLKGGKQVTAADLETKLKRYKSVAGINARFEQKKELKAADLVLKSTGEFRLGRDGEKAVVDWTLLKPSYLRLHITDKTIESSEKPGEAGKPVVESKEVQARILRPIYAWLTMDSKLIAEQFDIRDCGYFSLSPKDTDSPINEIIMRLDSKGLVSKVELGEKSGDGLLITFLDTKVTRTADSTAGAGGKPGAASKK